MSRKFGHVDWTKKTSRDEYREFLKNILKTMSDTWERKNAEYATDGDVFRNFRQVAELEGDSPHRSLLTKVSKHIIALFDFVEYLDEGKKIPLWQWQEKCGDIRVYSTLLEGMITLEDGFLEEEGGAGNSDPK